MAPDRRRRVAAWAATVLVGVAALAVGVRVGPPVDRSAAWDASAAAVRSGVDALPDGGPVVVGVVAERAAEVVADRSSPLRAGGPDSVPVAGIAALALAAGAAATRNHSRRRPVVTAGGPGSGRGPPVGR